MNNLQMNKSDLQKAYLDRTLHERCDDYYRKLNTLLKSWRLHAPDEEYLLISDLQARVKELEARWVSVEDGT